MSATGITVRLIMTKSSCYTA